MNHLMSSDPLQMMKNIFKPLKKFPALIKCDYSYSRKGGFILMRTQLKCKRFAMGESHLISSLFTENKWAPVKIICNVIP